MVGGLKIMVERNLHGLLKAMVMDVVYNELILDVVFLMTIESMKLLNIYTQLFKIGCFKK